VKYELNTSIVWHTDDVTNLKINTAVVNIFIPPEEHATIIFSIAEWYCKRLSSVCV
jgi:hypothetical protein